MQFIRINKKYIIGIGIFLISIMIIFGVNYLDETETVSAEPIIEESKIIDVKEEINKKIKIEIKGAVNIPGVYELDIEARVIDAINKAGGLTENADISLINLSKKVTDEMVIIIYTNEEIKNYNESKIKTEYVYIEVNNCPDPINDACIKEYEEGSKNIENNSESKVININTASIDELTTLSGIGESKAKLIIEYREQNGKYSNINELTNVKGIGESLIEKIKDNITV